jgi:membrane associated rhomboid family serine protease
MTDESPPPLDKQHPGFSAVLKHAWDRSLGSISLLIVVVCVLLFLGVTIVDVLNIYTRQKAVFLLGLSFTGVYRNHWYHQFVTAPFLHGSIQNLLFNMLTLWMLGPSVEDALGRRRYLFISFLCAGCAMVAFFFFNWGGRSVLLGYSGVIFGLLVAQAVFFPDHVISIFAFFPLRMKHAVMLLGAVELYLVISQEGGKMAHSVHLVGAVVAFFYLKGLSLFRSPKERRSKNDKLSHVPKPIRRKGRRDIPKEL